MINTDLNCLEVSESRRLRFYNPAIDLDVPDWVTEYLRDDAPRTIFDILMGCDKCDRDYFYEGIFDELNIFYSMSEEEAKSIEQDFFKQEKFSKADRRTMKLAISQCEAPELVCNSLEEMVAKSIGMEKSLDFACECSMALNTALMFEESMCNQTGLTPNLVTSLCEDGLQRPCLDLDSGFPGAAKLDELLSDVLNRSVDASYVRVNSTNNEHLYIPDIALDNDEYFLFLKLLELDGYLEVGYVNSSIARGYSSLRLPWVTKPGGENGRKLLKTQARVAMGILIMGLTEVGKKRYPS